MGSPDKSERSADAPRSEYAPKWAGTFHQPTRRRLGRFPASGGFIIAGALGVVIGLLITGALRNMGGNAPRSSTSTTELTSRFDNSKMPDQVGLSATGHAIAPTGSQPTHLSSPAAGPPIAPPVAQQAKEAPAHLATVGVASETAPAVRGVTGNEIRFGDFRTIHWVGQRTRPEYEAGHRGGVQRRQC